MRTSILTSGVLLVLASTAHAQSGTAASPESGVDPGVRPGDDFFAYANGAWLKSSEIPPGRDRWSARTEIDQRTREQLAKLLSAAGNAPVGTVARKVADFRAAWSNESLIERRGLAPIAPMLDSIARLADKTALARYIGSHLGTDVDPLYLGNYESSRLLGLSVERGIHGEPRYIAFLLQGGLGLAKDGYVSLDTAGRAVRSQYRDYIAGMLGRIGLDDPVARAQEVLALEAAIAASHATSEESSNDHNADNGWSRADFARKAPGMDWSAVFGAAGLASQESVVVWQPRAVKGAAELVGSKPLEVWKDYLRFHLVDEYADLLPRAISEPAQKVHTLTAGKPPGPRDQRATEATQLALGDAVGRMYVERYFPPQYKARVDTIAANVIAAFRRRLEGVTWMSPRTKATALAKLKVLYFGIGYPARWQDYSDLAVDPGDPVGNLARVADRNHRHAIARLGQPVDRFEWWIAPQTVGAVLVFQQNEYNFPAALLQSPKFDPSASDAMNYGAIGAIVGHEVSHFVDRLGAEYDADGQLNHWWTPEDSVRFAAVTAPLVDQFSGYRPFPDLSVNGSLTQTENIADLGGLMAAFHAYRATLGERVKDRNYVRSTDREFFLGFARSWRSRIAPEALRKQVATNDHAPEMYRIATVRNVDAWYEAFDVKPGDSLYLAPAARVRIW